MSWQLRWIFWVFFLKKINYQRVLFFLVIFVIVIVIVVAVVVQEKNLPPLTSTDNALIYNL